MPHTVRDWMSKPVVVVDPDSSVSYAMTLMRRRNIHSVIVNIGQDNVAYGIITTTDIRDKIAAADRNPAEIAVRDHGPGVPEQHMGSLFAPFTRVAHARERSSGGAGLGLAIARRAVELHQGGVSARNRPEGGLEVVLWLPLEGDAAADQRSS